MTTVATELAESTVASDLVSLAGPGWSFGLLHEGTVGALPIASCRSHPQVENGRISPLDVGGTQVLAVPPCRAVDSSIDVAIDDTPSTDVTVLGRRWK